MKLRAGYPFSLIKYGLPFDYPKLEKNIQTGVLIMGGGISGALAAHYLMKCGINCTLVDARTIGLGSTCASTSLLQYEIDTPLHQLISMVGYKNAVRSYQLCGRAITKLGELAKQTDFRDFKVKSSLYYAAYKKDIPFLEKEFAVRKKNGFDVKWWEKSLLTW